MISLLPKPEIPDKVCALCTNRKPVTEFSRSKSALDGYASRCKECRKRAEVHTRMQPLRQLRARLKHYGMTVDAFYSLIEAQNGMCQICAKPFSKPCIDHDHSTGQVRGLLCNRCNQLLAGVEDTDFRGRAEKYLEMWRATPGPFTIRPRWFESRAANAARVVALRKA